ncbi:DUF1178 family protein [Falsiroseomonas selenitidurans]|uniref:DUF1178 family protein n=1 Tax=Falsiroseomonas selenitidurans TaxID=2716335 RepID=A0ABX1DYF8_9PROT|nr:DUF1178 family protein [Falsiroseomonas selenitidurans]NKC29919.1 DUF1178 family protein [Falsiroseomonas selenitidurans]
MIHYQLRCQATHEFDGWFQDSAGFEKLAAVGLVECPHCGSTQVSRALMAPAVRKSRRKAAPAPLPEEAPPAAAPAPAPSAPPQPEPGGMSQRVAAGPIPAQLLAMLQRMRAEVEKSCDYVGEGFAEEARKIHNGEAEARGIYGEATEAEAEALAEDGIDIARLPWVPRADG